MTSSTDTPPQLPSADGTEFFTERTPRIVNAAKLHRTAARRKTGQFIAEGENAVTAALKNGHVEEIFVTEQAWTRFPFLWQITNVPVSPINQRAAERLAETVSTTGIFALCKNQLVESSAVIGHATSTVPLISVLVETADPGNAGTIVRVSDAFGLGGVVFAGQTVDPQSGKAVRSSAGSLFNLPVARNTGIADVIEQLHAAEYQVLATAADGVVELPELADSTNGPSVLSQPTAWLFGNEAHGLGDWLDLADIRVSIPMRGNAESLNLATAASVCLYESSKAQAAAGR